MVFNTPNALSTTLSLPHLKKMAKEGAGLKAANGTNTPCDDLSSVKIGKRGLDGPASSLFLNFIDFYKQLYVVKVDDITIQEKNVNNGLVKLKEAAEFVGKLQLELKDQEVVIAGASLGY